MAMALRRTWETSRWARMMRASTSSTRALSPTLRTGADFADLAALRAWWDAVHVHNMAYLRDADTAELQREIHYHNTQGREFTRRVWHALLHVANHQTEHRSQIAGMLTHFGVAAPATDLVVFLNPRP